MNKTSKISLFFLMLFLVTSFSQLSASNEKQLTSSIETSTTFDDETLYLYIKVPSHLALRDTYSTSRADSNVYVKGRFSSTEYFSKENPASIFFSVLAENTDKGINIFVDTKEMFIDRSCCIPSLSEIHNCEISYAFTG